jgi:hypothetical protein
MSYMRGRFYIYEGDAGLYFSEEGMDRPILIPMEVFDELTAMRAAELQEEGRWEAVRQQTYEKWRGNYGCEALADQLGLPNASDLLEEHLKEKKG